MQALAMKGKVYLMGAGPGDTDLLTVKAVHVLRAAEVVLHDDLVSPQILELVRPGRGRFRGDSWRCVGHGSGRRRKL